MTSTVQPSPKLEAIWRRWWRRLVELEAAMEMTKDDFQDRRMDRIEAELARLRADVDAIPTMPARS